MLNSNDDMAINTSMDIKEVHDELMKQMPSGAEHDAESCPICAHPGEGRSDDDSLTRGGDMSTTYTKEDIDSAVAEAVKPLQDRIRELETASEQSELQARFDQEKAELEEKVRDLQTQLDSAVLTAEEAKSAYQGLLDFLAEEVAREEAAREVEARKESRLAVVSEVAKFPEEYVKANADRWAELSDEEFEAVVNDWKAISASTASEELPPAGSALSTERETAASSKRAISEVLSFSVDGFKS